MTRKKYYTKNTQEEIAQICREFPIEKVQALLEEGLSDKEAGKRLGISEIDFKVLICFYRCLGKL